MQLVAGWFVGAPEDDGSVSEPALVVDRVGRRVVVRVRKGPWTGQPDEFGRIRVEFGIPASALVAAIGMLHRGVPVPGFPEIPADAPELNAIGEIKPAVPTTGELAGKLRRVVERRLDDLLRGMWSSHDELVSLTGLIDRLSELERD